MGNQSSAPKKRLNYLKNNPPRSQIGSQNRSVEEISQKHLHKDAEKKTKSISPIQKDLTPQNFQKYYEINENERLQKQPIITKVAYKPNF